MLMWVGTSDRCPGHLACQLDAADREHAGVKGFGEFGMRGQHDDFQGPDHAMDPPWHQVMEKAGTLYIPVGLRDGVLDLLQRHLAAGTGILPPVHSSTPF